MRSLIIALIVALGLSGYGLYVSIGKVAAQKIELSQKNDALERAARRVKSDRKVLVAREAVIASTARKLAAESRKLQDALQRNNDWSNTSVPADVQEALAGPSDGLAWDSGTTQPEIDP